LAELGRVEEISMPDEERVAKAGRDERKIPGTDVVSAITTASVSALGDLVAAKGHANAAFDLKSSAPFLGYVASRGWTGVGLQFVRVKCWWENVRSRAKDQKIEDKLPYVADVVEQAIPIIGNESAPEKRKMMEDIILNAAWRIDESTAAVQSMEALRMIEALPAPAAIVFAVISTDPHCILRDVIGWASASPTCPLPPFMVTKAVQHLRGEYQPTVVGAFAVGDRPHLVSEPARANEKGEVQVADHLELTEEGKWLADWIASHPTPDSMAKES
jgi:hypothetical protein